MTAAIQGHTLNRASSTGWPGQARPWSGEGGLDKERLQVPLAGGGGAGDHCSDLRLRAVETRSVRRRDVDRDRLPAAARSSNAEAARRAGIDVRRMRIAAFAISSTLAAFGGLALASYNGGVALDIGGGNTLLYAVGAAVVGGTSLFGGRGRIRDALLGGIVISLIPNGLGLKVNINAAYLYIITGAFLLLAAAADAFGRRRQSV